MVKKFSKLLVAALLSVTLGVLSACTPPDSGTSDPGKKPTASVEQDLSMFDNVLHYGIEQVATYALTIKNDNVTFSTGGKTVNLIEKAVIPEVVCTTEGEYIVGVKNVKTGKITEDYRFRMPAEDTEIEFLTSTEKPVYFKQLNPDGFDYNSAGSSTDWQVVEGTFEQNSPFTMNADFNISVDKYSVDINGNSDEDYLRGNILRISGVAGNMSRVVTFAGEADTEEGIVAGETYTFIYNFENFGENAISFRFHQVQTQIKLGNEHNPSSKGAGAVNAGKTITLDAGEHASYKISFTADNQNANILPVVELRSVFDNELLGVAIAKENADMACEHNIEKIEAQEGDCGKAGNIEYFGCSDCGGMWSDVNGEHRVSVPEITVKKAHTLTEYTEIKESTHRLKCSICKGVPTQATPHEFTYRVVKEPNGEEKGVKEEACDCGYKSGNTIEYMDTYTLTVVTADGNREFKAKVDEPLPSEISELLDEEFYNVNDTNEIFAKETFVMPERDLTVKNFDTQEGTVITRPGDTGPVDYYGGSKNYSDKLSGIKTEDGKVLTGKEIGVDVSQPDVQLRFKSGYNAEYSSISVNGMTFRITIENRYGKPITFDIAQVNGGTTKLEGAYENGVTLAAGESKTFTFKFPLTVGSNANALTLMKFTGLTAGERLKFGFAIFYEELVPEMQKLTVAMDDGNCEFQIEAGKPLPEEAKALLNGGFYNVDNTVEGYDAETFLMPEKDVTVKKCDQSTGTAVDVYNTHWTAQGSANVKGVSLSGIKTSDGKILKGKQINFDNATSSVIRIASPYGSNISVNGLTYHITIENRSGQAVTFGIAQINSGSNKINGAYEDNVTLQAGESRTFTFTFPDGMGTNGNALTLFTFGADVPSDVIFGMALSYELPQQA